jgi:hypothetical protein
MKTFIEALVEMVSPDQLEKLYPGAAVAVSVAIELDVYVPAPVIDPLDCGLTFVVKV